MLLGSNVRCVSFGGSGGFGFAGGLGVSSGLAVSSSLASWSGFGLSTGFGLAGGAGGVCADCSAADRATVRLVGVRDCAPGARLEG